MSFLTVVKYASSVTSFVILFILLLLITSLRSPEPAATTIIDFEALNAPGTDLGGLQIRNQFAAKGIIFQPVTAFDYSQSVPTPNFAHSGTKAIELCFAQEFCKAKLEISFTAPQRRVQIWIGYNGKLDTVQPVIMRAFDGNGNQVGQAANTLGPTTSVRPISTRMTITLPSATIVRITAGFTSDEAFSNGLAFDDIEFDDQGAAPACQATQPPAFTVSEPTEGRIVIKNEFTLDANLTTPDPFATLQVNSVGLGGTRTFGPVFVAAGNVSIFNISGLLFPGKNVVTFVFRDCGGTRQTQRTVFFRNDVTRTGIRVIDEKGLNVSGAQVYANGAYLGNTDQAGMVFASSLLHPGTALVARRFITESSSYRDHHSKGSSKDWNYRVYISNVAVSNNGSLINTNLVNYEPDPLKPQLVRVLRKNTLFGLHVVASIEWDASAAEMETVRRKLLSASRFLYNATDGQILIEQAEVVDNAKYWRDADYRVYANQSLRAFVDYPLGGFLSGVVLPGTPLPPLVLSRMHMDILSAGATYAHEFGHYGFDLRDEYKDEHPEVHCTAKVSVDSDKNCQGVSPKASCMMWRQHCAPKLCSGRPEDPHVNGTRQGGSSCWSTFARNYDDDRDRWILQTPDTRGAIVGPVNGGSPPVDAWAPRFTFDNSTHPNLCQPQTYVLRHSDGTPDFDREVWLETSYGDDILQGKADREQGIGELIATGIHVGDKVNGHTVTPAECVPIAMTLPSPHITSPSGLPFALARAVPVAFSQNPEGQQVQRLEIAPAAFNVFTTLKPTAGESAEISVRVGSLVERGIVTLQRPPIVQVSLRGEKTLSVPLRYRTAMKAYVASLKNLPINAEIEIEVTATNHQRQTVHTVGRFNISRPDPRYESDVFSSDGQISLTLPPKALPPEARIAFGPPSTILPPLPEGYSVAAGPLSVWSFPDNRLSEPATLRFHLSQRQNDLGSKAYSDKTLKVFHYDAENHKWEDLGGIVHPDPIGIVVIRTSRLGLFALVGMKTEKNYLQSEPSMTMFSPGKFGFADMLSQVFGW